MIVMAVVSPPRVVVVTLLSILSVAGAVDQCPPWFTLDNIRGTRLPQCVCSNPMEFEITCNLTEQKSFLQLGYWAFQDSNGTVVAGCPYVFPDHLIVDHLIPLPNKSSELNQFICGNLNRDIEAPLCGRCTNGTGPSIYSAGSQCVSCSAVNIVYYLLLRYVPMTILFVAIIMLRVINITTAPMAHYVLLCNGFVMFFRMFSVFIMCVNAAGSFSPTLKILLTLMAIWSLDVFYFVSPPLCVSEHMEEIYIPFLDIVATLYPFILLLLTYVGIELHDHDFRPVVFLWRPIHITYVKFRKTWDPSTSLIQAFATLFFLSYTKLTMSMHEALMVATVINEKGRVVTRVTYIDPTVGFFSHKHNYSIILYMFLLVFLILPPLLLLIIFPTRLFRKVSKCLKPRRTVSIQTFVDTFHGCYKDGTNGTRDYRAISGYILAIFAFFPALQTTIDALFGPIYLALLPLILFIMLTVVAALLKPYKLSIANRSAVAVSATFALSVTLYLSQYSFPSIYVHTTVVILSGFLLCLPHCVFYGYIVYRLGKLLKQYCCKTREMEGSVDEQLPCRPTNTANYSQLVEVLPNEECDNQDV